MPPACALRRASVLPLFLSPLVLLVLLVLLGATAGCGGPAGSTDGASQDDVDAAGLLASDGDSSDVGDGGLAEDLSAPLTDADGGPIGDDLTGLPADSGGMHIAKPLGTTTAAYGYYLYVPAGYDSTTMDYPIVVFLHGKGERGNGTTDLGKLLGLGLPKVIAAGKFHPSHPMLVASPQFPPTDGIGNENNWGEGDPSKLKTFIQHLQATYRVNAARIYLTGLSHGGNGVYDYLVGQDDATSLIAAAAPVAAYGPGSHFDRPRHTPIWVFVGSADVTNYNTSKSFVTGYNAQVPGPTVKARFTVWQGAPHDVWSRTYDLSGMGTAWTMYDPYDKSVFDWMLGYRR